MAYKVVGMLKNGGLGKDMTSGIVVPYKSERERAEYEVTVLSSGQLRWQFSTFDNADRQFLYVMDGDGNIYTADDDEVKHHSAFLAGQPVAAAGMWGVKNGRLTWINSESGHYQPPGDYCEQILQELKKRGAKVDMVKKNFAAPSAQCIVGMKKLAGISGLKWWQRETGAVVVKDYVDGVSLGNADNPVRIESGSHIRGQRLRLYPGKKPEWSWF
jgi:hypothetical protein